MGYVFNDETLKVAIRDCSYFAKTPPIVYSPDDLATTKLLFESESFISLLPPVDERSSSIALPTTSTGEYICRGSSGDFVVPKEFSPLVEYVFYKFSCSPDYQESGFLDKIINYISSMVDWFLNNKTSLQDQINEIIKDADNFYGTMREEIHKKEAQYGDDSSLEYILLIPDMFVYLCRILGDDTVPKEAKVEIVLALIYLISPIDFIPEAFISHPIALLDDFGIMLVALKRSIEGGYIDKQTFERNWPGRVDVMDNLTEWYEAVETVIGKENLLELWRALINKIKSSPNNAQSSAA